MNILATPRWGFVMLFTALALALALAMQAEHVPCGPASLGHGHGKPCSACHG